MKSLSIIAILSVLVLTGCAYPAYQRGYGGYSSGYSTGYGMQSYSSGYPASVYYRQSTVPSYSYQHSAPRYDYGVQHYEGGRSHNRQESHGVSQDRWQAERNLQGVQHSRGTELQRQPHRNGQDGLSQRMQQSNNNELRTGSRGGWESGRGGDSHRDGEVGRRHGHDGR